jgi:hypothetical protein
MSAAAPSKAGGLKLGAEPKKVVILGILLAVAAALLISNLSSNDSGAPASPTPVTHPATAPVAAAPIAHEQATRRRPNQRSSERNILRMRTVTVEAQRGDIDPTLRLDLLARLKNVRLTGGERSLFEAGAAPVPAAAVAPPTKIMPGPLPSTAPASGQEAAAGPPPVVIPLKFYGFSAPATATGPRAGFFLDGDNIIIANEGELIKNRYRIVKLMPKSAEVQDVIAKVQQTLPLTPEGTE